MYLTPDAYNVCARTSAQLGTFANLSISVAAAAALEIRVRS
jgi:hypothetical protein